MAKTLNISLNGQAFSLAQTKVDRKKLYGYTEVRGIDIKTGRECRRAGLDSNGVTIVPSGATKTGMISEDGTWTDKSELIAVNQDGSEAVKYPSSFDKQIQLFRKATIEEVLDTIITSLYMLSGEDSMALVNAIGNDIYTFKFNYTAGYGTSDAFLLSNGQECFVLIGDHAEFEMIDLEEAGTIDNEEEEQSEEEDFDFGMF